MKNYLTKNNVRESLKEVIERNHIKVESFNDFVRKLLWKYWFEVSKWKGGKTMAEVFIGINKRNENYGQWW